MSFPPSAAPKAATNSPPGKTAPTPTGPVKSPSPKAKPSAQKGPPISAAFHAPGATPPAAAPAGAPPIAAPTDVASNLAHLTGKAIAQAILGGFASQIAQPK